MTRAPDQIVMEFDALNGVGEGHFIDEMETEELKLLIARIKTLETVCKRDRFADGYAAGAEDFGRIGGRRIEALEAALQRIADAGDGYTTGDGHARCQEIARAVLAPEQDK